MPYPNEHACRLLPPEGFPKKRRHNYFASHNGLPYDVIWGIPLRGGIARQAYRYRLEEGWSADEAREH